MSTPPPTRRLEVDGETFEVRPSQHHQGFDFDWVTGPNPGYGFSSGVSMVFTSAGQPSGEAPAMDEQTFFVSSIKSFLRQIDPTTGYIAD